MRIALVTSEAPLGNTRDGGLGHAVFRLSRALTRNNQDVCVIQPGEENKSTESDGVRIVTVNARRPSWHRWVNRISYGQFDAGLRLLHLSRTLSEATIDLNSRWKFDLAHFSNLGGISAFCPRRIPQVIRISSDTPSTKMVGGHDNQNRLAMFQQERIEAWAIRRADAVYSPSSHVGNIVSRRHRRPVEVIRPPVFPETTSRDDSVLRKTIGEGKFLLFYGRLNRLKGLPDLADFLEELLESNPDLQVVVIGREHAGHQGMTMADYLRLKAGAHAGRLVIMDPLPHEQLFPILEKALAVLVPSIIDNLPNTMLESMMLGKVVIGTRGTGVDEFIEDGRTGLLCRPRDPEDLHRVIKRCLHMSDATRRQIGLAAKKRMIDLRPEKTIPPLLEFFSRVVQEHMSGRHR